MGNLKQYENLNMGNLKQFKPQDGKEDVTRSFVGPVVGGQGHLGGNMDGNLRNYFDEKFGTIL